MYLLKIVRKRMKITASQESEMRIYHLISNFRRVLNVVCFLLGYSRASEFCVPTFRNTVPSSQAGWFFTQPPAYEDGTDRVFRNVGTQNSDARE